MNLSHPMMICDENEEFRFLLRDMLTKNGYFHVLEATDSSEALSILTEEKRDLFLLIDMKILSEEMVKILSMRKHFIIFNQPTEQRSALLAARLGVKHMMSFPFSSQKLVKKIHSLFQ